jgi:hypothetical protein
VQPPFYFAGWGIVFALVCRGCGLVLACWCGCKCAAPLLLLQAGLCGLPFLFCVRSRVRPSFCACVGVECGLPCVC